MAIRGALEAHGPIAAEHHAVRAEGIQAVVDDRRQVRGGPALRRAGDDPRDLADDVLAMANREGMSIFLFGAKESILKLCLGNILIKYPNIVIAGSRNGYYKPEEEQDIFDLINKANPDILLLGMSSPKKELFFESYRHKLAARYILGVGGYFDIMSGLIRRAPHWMQDTGFEWLFRLMQEPRRLWKRYLIGIFQFFWLVTKEKFRRFFTMSPARSACAPR